MTNQSRVLPVQLIHEYEHEYDAGEGQQLGRWSRIGLGRYELGAAALKRDQKDERSG